MANIKIDPSMLNPAQRAQLLQQRGYTAAQVAGMSPDQLLGALSASNPGVWDGIKGFFNKNKTAGASGTGASGAASTAGAGASAAAGSGSKFKLFSDGLGQKVKSGASGLLNPQFDWNKQNGLQGWGKNLGGYLNLASGVAQGIDFAQGLGNLSDEQRNTDDLIADIISGSMNNPMVNYDLTPDQVQLLNQLKRGTYGTDVGIGDANLLGALGSAGTGAITGFLGGGTTGALIGGIGGLLNSGVDDLSAAQARKNAELEALYAALQESNKNYGDIRRQRMLASL